MTERYLGSIISPSPTDPSSNLSNATASGVWNIHDPLIFGQAGDWPDPTNVPSVGIATRGQTNPLTTNIDKFVPESASNATDFGDLTVARHAASSMGNDTRAIFAGGADNYGGSSFSNVIDYITYATTGNATDFGDMASARPYANASASNNVRGISFGGFDGSTVQNIIEYITIASTGNATDFGDLSVTPNTSANKGRNRQGNGMSGSSTRGLASGGYTPAALSNVIQYVTIASAGDSTDFGDMSAATDELGFMSSNTRAVIAGGSGGGGSFRNTMEYVTIASTGNVTDFGDMTVAKAFLMGASSSTKGFVIGGSTSSNLSDSVNTIETITFSTTGDGTAFADLTAVGRSGSANASSHAAVQNESYFAPAAMGLFAGGEHSSGGQQSTIEYIDIATTGRVGMFGDLTSKRYGMNGGAASSTRGVFGGGITVDIIEYVTFSTKGKATDFGNLSGNRYTLAATSNSTRGLFSGGDNGSTEQDTVEYITIASTGNVTDFGNLSVASKEGSSLSSTTRMVTNVGETGSGSVNTIDYFTIASTGNATDFGDLTTVARRNTSASSNTRGIFAGGLRTSNSNIIEYITIASTGNATDFGDLTEARSKLTAVSSSIRAVLGTGVTGLNAVDYITIASTGNAIDWGDLNVNAEYKGSASNSHGGI